eukprot:comp21846_c0_seq2/m.49375 comp21846_c0_seq2/g.49375  ORF comp21846_c0_seq2/g.49375 comp21846_c0_seq2/m.49375 type:complete len:456 (+) comp21846_c0_seq2:1423-2790(+)
MGLIGPGPHRRARTGARRRQGRRDENHREQQQRHGQRRPRGHVCRPAHFRARERKIRIHRRDVQSERRHRSSGHPWLCIKEHHIQVHIRRPAADPALHKQHSHRRSSQPDGRARLALRALGAAQPRARCIAAHAGLALAAAQHDTAAPAAAAVPSPPAAEQQQSQQHKCCNRIRGRRSAPGARAGPGSAHQPGRRRRCTRIGAKHLGGIADHPQHRFARRGPRQPGDRCRLPGPAPACHRGQQRARRRGHPEAGRTDLGIHRLKQPGRRRDARRDRASQDSHPLAGDIHKHPDELGHKAPAAAAATHRVERRGAGRRRRSVAGRHCGPAPEQADHRAARSLREPRCARSGTARRAPAGPPCAAHHAGRCHLAGRGHRRQCAPLNRDRGPAAGRHFGQVRRPPGAAHRDRQQDPRPAEQVAGQCRVQDRPHRKGAPHPRIQHSRPHRRGPHCTARR